MSTKKKNPTKGDKGNVGNENLSRVDRKFYELEITHINRNLATAKRRLAYLEKRNEELEKAMSMEEQDELFATLQDDMEKRTKEIFTLEAFINEMLRDHQRKEDEYKAHIVDLEKKYKAMQNQLKSDIKMLTGKLATLAEFQLERDRILDLYESKNLELEAMEHKIKEFEVEMEEKLIVSKEETREQVSGQINRLVEDFMRSTETRNAGFVRRIMRENVALRQEIQAILKTYFQMKLKVENAERREYHLRTENQTFKDLKHQLLLNANNKHKIIENLISNYEKLKSKHVEISKYRYLYENLMQRSDCDNKRKMKTEEKLKRFKQRIELIEREKNKLMNTNQRLELDVRHLRETINKTKSAILCYVDSTNYLKQTYKKLSAVNIETEEYFRAERQDLLKSLQEILCLHMEENENIQAVSVETLERSKSSIYRIGDVGFVPLTQQSLMDLFKRDEEEICQPQQDIEESSIAERKVIQVERGLFIPEARQVQNEQLIDVEVGSDLYVSSSEPEDQDEVEEVAVEEEEGESSSDEEIPAIPLKRLTEEKESKPLIGEKTSSIAGAEEATSRYSVLSSDLLQTIEEIQVEEDM
uniref:Cilia- and flagella-associated protein 157 n=1 Tax=Glossina brevipalpis TaxID=37001 RepID=A0A1A9WNF6_9MUSC